MKKNRCLALLLLTAALFLPAPAEAGCHVSCPNGGCWSLQGPATCCCDLSGSPHCGVFDINPCRGGGGWEGAAQSTADATVEGFLAYLASGTEPAAR